MYANKNKEKNSKSRTVATGADSTKLSSKDSRYDAGDYEAVPESIRKIRDARNRELEEQNALPAEEIIARQEAEIAELKRQAEAANMTNKYKSVLDDEEEHPTFKNPDSMADFGDYEAVASTARFEAAGRDPNKKVFRAKPAVSTRKVAPPSDLTPGDYEAVAASARHAVPPDEFVPDSYDDNDKSDSAAPENSEEYMTDAESARASREAPSRDVPEYTAPADDNEVHSEPYTPPMAASSSDDEIHSEPYTPPQPAPEPVSAADYTVQSSTAPEPQPAPAPVSAADYMVQNDQAPEPAPAPVSASASDYTANSYSSSNDNAVHSEPYSPPGASSSSYTSQEYVPPAQRAKYSNDGNYDVGGGPVYSPTSGRRIASVVDMAPGDYEAVAASTYDDSDMDLADGSYDFDKFLAGAPSLQMQPAHAPTPEETEWADLGTDKTADIDDVDITDEQTRALTEAIAQETLSNQPGTQFEDIIDNVIAKVMERKKAEDAAKAAEQQKQPEQPKEPEKPEQPEQPKEPEKTEQLQQPEQPQEPEQQKPEPQPEQQPAQPEAQQPEQPAEEKHGLAPGSIDPATPIENIPALIVAELDSGDGEVSDDDIRKSIDAALIGKLTTGEVTLDSVQSIRNKIMDEVHEMQEEEARILAQLEGKPEKHPFDPDFLPADIAVEDIPDAVVAELDNIEGEVSDDEVKKSIDKVMIVKLSKGELTLDSFQEARNDIFETLGIETAEEQTEEKEEKEEKAEEPPAEKQPEEEPVKEQREEEPVEEPAEEESVEEEAPVEEPAKEEAVEEEAPAEEQAEEVAEEPVTEPEPEPVEETIEEPEPVEETSPVEESEESETIEETESGESTDSESEHAPEAAPAEDEEEEGEKTTPIPVPKEPTVLEYDPYADVFVNPSDEPEEAEESEEPEKVEDSDLSEEPEEPAETEEAEDSDELLETPLSAAAVLAMQDQQDEEAESAEETEATEETETEPEPEEATDEPEPTEEEPAEKIVEEAEPAKDEEEDTLEEQAENDESEHDSVLDRQITFDDIMRNPFVNDFEPLNPFVEAKDDSNEPQTEATTETEPEVESEPEAESPSEEQPGEESEDEAEPVEDAPESAPEEPESTEEEPEPAEEPVTEEEPGSTEEAVDVEEPATEEQTDEYAEAKARRHDDMQNALLMAMIDDKEKTFSDAVNYMIDQDGLNAKTLRTRMPIDRDTLDRVIKEHDYVPDKKTAIAICFALRLTWEDSVRLLYKAGYSLNDTERYDLTIEYLMRRGVYDQNMINSVLMGSGLDGFGIPQSEIK